MLLCNYLKALKGKNITLHEGARSLTVQELRRRHRAYLDTLVITLHRKGHSHTAEVRTAAMGIYLFTIRYYWYR
jgi:hypothetical protein